jgi:import inner membrane translocase subunit TIM54
MSGALSFLEFVGIPRSWLSKRPRLPSRNWLIFIGSTSTLAAAYIHDRRECNRIKLAHIDTVKHLADGPMRTDELPRKVTVYVTKWPGDDDYDRGAIWFKKYVKVCSFGSTRLSRLVNHSTNSPSWLLQRSITRS